MVPRHSLLGHSKHAIGTLKSYTELLKRNTAWKAVTTVVIDDTEPPDKIRSFMPRHSSMDLLT